MDKRERFNKAYGFLKYEGIIKTQTDVASKMGATQSNVSGALRGRDEVLTNSFLRRFANAFKQISIDWLLYEEGPMLTIKPEFKSENTPQVLESYIDKDVWEEQVKMTERIMELVHDSGQIPKTFALEADIEVSLFLKKLKGQAVWSVADIHKICDAFRVRKGWLVDGEGQKFRLPDSILETIPARRSYEQNSGKPYYNVDFEMGFDAMENDQTRNPDYMVDFPPYNKCDLWCNARGDSMFPTISSGDFIAIKEVKDAKSCLISGEIYAIVTTNDLRTIKRVKDNGDTVTLIPDNKAYPEQIIPKEMILKVFRVLGSVKSF